MNNQLMQVKTQVAASIADEKRLHQRFQENQAKSDDWKRKAEIALDRGEDDLAKEALSRRNSFRESARGPKRSGRSKAPRSRRSRPHCTILSARSATPRPEGSSDRPQPSR